MQGRRSALIVGSLAAVLTAACGDTRRLAVDIVFDVAACSPCSAPELIELRHPGKLRLFALDAEVDPQLDAAVLAEACLDYTAGEPLALAAVPSILSEQAAELGPFAEDRSIRLQLQVHPEGQGCPSRFRGAGAAPPFWGESEAVTVADGGVIVPLRSGATPCVVACL